MDEVTLTQEEAKQMAAALVVAQQCIKEQVDKVQALELQNGEMLELLRQANELYTGYGLICGPIKDFPKYEGSIHQGEWIGKVRAIVRQSEKRMEESPKKCAICSRPAGPHCHCGHCPECEGY